MFLRGGLLLLESKELKHNIREMVLRELEDVIIDNTEILIHAAGESRGRIMSLIHPGECNMQNTVG
jgi:hypothetical protein